MPPAAGTAERTQPAVPAIDGNSATVALVNPLHTTDPVTQRFDSGRPAEHVRSRPRPKRPPHRGDSPSSSSPADSAPSYSSCPRHLGHHSRQGRQRSRPHEGARRGHGNGAKHRATEIHRSRSSQSATHRPSPSPRSTPRRPGPIKKPGPSISASKVETTNSVGQTMILIPPGEFLMGSTDEQVEAALKVADEIKADQATKDRIQKNERPQHKVVITKPFLMSATEVTIGQFKKFAAATGYQTEAEKRAAAPAVRQDGRTYLDPPRRATTCRRRTSPGTTPRPTASGFQPKRKQRIACRPKRSGNTPAGPGRRRSIRLATTRRC